MQISRLFEIVTILFNKKTVTAKELAEHFEVSVRTIYRDINALSAAKIPIYATQGKGGGIALLDDYVLNKSILSEKEQTDILFALQSFTATQYPEVENVLSKLGGLFNKNGFNWIEVDFSFWGSRKDQMELFNTLKESLINQKVISFEYNNASGEFSRRRVEPQKLIFRDSAWYLRGFCLARNAVRTFKISRMSELQTTDDIFIKRPFDETEKKTGESEPAGWLDICLKFSPEGAYRVFDAFDKHHVVRAPDGSFIVKTSLPEGEWLIDFIMSFGALVEVAAPKEIREIIIHRLEDSLKKYKNSSIT